MEAERRAFVGAVGGKAGLDFAVVLTHASSLSGRNRSCFGVASGAKELTKRIAS